MKLVPVSPQPYHLRHEIWSLLKDQAGGFYLFVNCEASFVSFDCLLKLNDEEMRDYHGLGWLSLQHLAHRVNHFSRDYSSRMVQGQDLDDARKCVEAR
jgi:hypothetical protein